MIKKIKILLPYGARKLLNKIFIYGKDVLQKPRKMSCRGLNPDKAFYIKGYNYET